MTNLDHFLLPGVSLDYSTGPSTGYSTTPYTIVAGVSDTNPLVGVKPRSSDGGDESGLSEQTGIYYTPPDDSTLLPINIIITGASFSSPIVPGGTGTLQLSLENAGTEIIPPKAKIVLDPENIPANEIGEQLVQYIASGQYQASFPITIPQNPGTYQYLFIPEEITTNGNPDEEIRICVGSSCGFMITITESGEVMVEGL